MAYVTPDKYSPYPRVCDVCGQLRSIATMRKLDGITWVCSKHTGERTRIALDLLNAHARPPQTWPVKDAKPQNPEYPNTLEADEGRLFNFIDRQIQAQCRYELVVSGAAPYVAAGDAVPTMAWAARYLYNLITQGTRTLLIARAKVLLASCASYLLSRQYGSLTGPLPSATQAGNAFYGGILASGATEFLTNDAATGGLALLYAYRVLGTVSCLVGARAAASYLRNVQAIGSSGSQHTSLDSAGTSRLYTGAVCSQVSTTSGVDPGQNFYSNHLFYPSGLVALEFWNELKTTDGDQSIGATTAVNGFDTIPAQLLSQSITDMRDCWETGIQTATTVVVNGFSTTTPKEYFNAYPAVKFGFDSISGTGLWEYADGNSADGTAITSQNFALALSSLFAYEGKSTQVTTILAWLRAFSSNADLETPDNTSPSVLARSTTGDYSPTLTLSTLLTVVDTTENGSSLYDWGAFGMLSPLLAATDMTSFKSSRLGPLNIRQRYDDGTRNDGLEYDRIELRGLSGLSYQSAFSSDTNDAGGPTSFTIGSAGTSSPPMAGLAFWVKWDVGVVSAAGKVTTWRDQGGQGQDLNVTSGGKEPLVGVDTVGGIGWVSMPVGSSGGFISRSATMKNSAGVAMTASDPRTVMAVILPRTSSSGFGFNITGGPVFSFREQACFECLFDLESFFRPSGFYLFANIWRFGGEELRGPPTSDTTYTGKTTLVEWTGSANTGAPVGAAVNGSNVALTPTTSLGAAGAAPPVGFVLGNCDNNTGTLNNANFQGGIAEVLIWDRILTGGDLTQARSYVASRYSSLSIGLDIRVTNDAVRAAQLGAMFREAH